ncbi:zinc ion binding [Nannochloropsis oceanica]
MDGEGKKKEQHVLKLGTLHSLAVLHFLRSTEYDMVSTPPADLADAPPSLQELVECADSLSMFDAVEGGREGGSEEGPVSMLLPRLVTVMQPMEEGSKKGEAQEEEEEEREEVERRPRKEAESLALAVNASLYWGTSALWGVFDSLNSTLQQEEEEEEGGREGGGSMKKEKKQQHFHHFYLPREVEESEKTPVVQAEIWPEQGPLGGVLRKKQEGQYHENGARSCMGYAKRSFNPGGDVAVFSLALCADQNPIPGTVASGVIKNLGSSAVCAVTLRVYKLAHDDEEEEDGREGGREPSLLSELRLEGYLAPHAFLVYQVQASADFSARDRHAVALLGNYSLCMTSKQADPFQTRSWAPPPPPPPPSSPVFKDRLSREMAMKEQAADIPTAPLPPHRRWIHDMEARVCDTCASLLLPLQPALRLTSSKATQALHIDRRSWARYFNHPVQFSLEEEIKKASYTLCNFTGDSALGGRDSIPGELLWGAKGLAFLTVVKAGMFVTARIGTGLVIARLHDEEDEEEEEKEGGGGREGRRRRRRRRREGEGKVVGAVGVGVHGSVIRIFVRSGSDGSARIALGPLGRTAATDLHYSSSSSSSSSRRRRRSRLGAGFSYGHSRGAFMGVSVEGSVLTARERVNQEFYGMKDVTVGGILSGEIPPPLAAFPLYKALEEVMGEGEGGREGGREACGTRWDSRNGMHGQQRSKTGRDGGEEGRQEEEEEDDGEDEEVGGLLRGMGGEMMTFQVMGE